MAENSEFGRKPLQLQRILSENVQSSKLKNVSKIELKCHNRREKENSSGDVVDDVDNVDDTVDHEWSPETAAMSSTMATGSALSTPRFFQTSSSNVSSINCSSDPFSTSGKQQFILNFLSDILHVSSTRNFPSVYNEEKEVFVGNTVLKM